MKENMWGNTLGSLLGYVRTLPSLSLFQAYSLLIEFHSSGTFHIGSIFIILLGFLSVSVLQTKHEI